MGESISKVQSTDLGPASGGQLAASANPLDHHIADALAERHVHRLDYLDAVRGVAALAVAVGHYLLGYNLLSNRGLARSPLSLFWDGNASVSMFFVLSGLVLSLRYLRTVRPSPLGDFSFPAFAVARFCRIVLPLAFALVATAIAHRLFFVRTPTTPDSPGFGALLWPHPSSLYWLARQAVVINPVYPLELPQTWTLTVELAVSLLVPAMVLVAAESTVWLLSMALLVWIATPQLGLFSYSFHFILGVALARHRADLTRLLHRKPFRCISLFAAGLVLYLLNDLVTGNIMDSTPIYRYLSGVGGAIILAVLLASVSMQRVMSTFWLRHLGRVSYGLYLLHLPVLLIVTPRWLADTQFLPPKISWGCGLAVTLLVSILLADLFHRFVESPSIVLGKIAGDRVRGTKSTR
jgi:peptidoglycan/LPS O-acetylase OafA/YrhL